MGRVRFIGETGEISLELDPVWAWRYDVMPGGYAAAMVQAHIEQHREFAYAAKYMVADLCRSMEKRLEIELLYGYTPPPDPVWAWRYDVNKTADPRSYRVDTMSALLKQTYPPPGTFAPPKKSIIPYNLKEKKPMKKLSKKMSSILKEPYDPAPVPEGEFYKQRCAELERECAGLRAKITGLESALGIVARGMGRGDH